MSKRLGQCDALLSSGARCRRQAVAINRYHGEPEIYGYDGPEPTWVRVEFCEKHTERKAAKRRTTP